MHQRTELVTIAELIQKLRRLDPKYDTYITWHHPAAQFVVNPDGEASGYHFPAKIMSTFISLPDALRKQAHEVNCPHTKSSKRKGTRSTDERND
jgi:hypothetical protein